MKRLFLVLMGVLVGSGCSMRIGTFTMASTKNLGTTYTPIQTGVTGEDCSQQILFVPLGTLNPNLQDAVDKAVEQVPEGDMMTNVTAYNDILFTHLYDRNCIRVVGDVVNTKSVAVRTATAPQTSAPVKSATQ
jgi:hypothetical protein